MIEIKTSRSQVENLSSNLSLGLMSENRKRMTVQVYKVNESTGKTREKKSMILY